MDKPLADIVSDIAKAKQTGILSISVKNNASLFKIFFREGEVYHVTHGTCKDMDCVTNLMKLDFDTGFFHLGATVDMKSSTVSPTEEIIAEIRNSGKKLKWTAGPAARTESAADNSSQKAVGAASASNLEAVERELIDIVGPIAPMLIEQVYGELRLKKGQPVPAQQMRQLILKLSENLPDEQKAAFIAKFN